MKQCTDCGQMLPVDAFYRDRSLRMLFCKQCFWTRYGGKQKARRREDDARASRRQWNRERPISDAHHATEIRHSKRRQLLHPEKMKATRAVRAAVERGDLVRPDLCPRCGDKPAPRRDGRSTLQAHHADYTRPLDVEWLCILCHSTEHRALKEPGHE